jgi:hypothetical protein
MYAPQGLRFLADALATKEFADAASVALDWTNELGLQPDEAWRPVLIVETIKFVGQQRLVVTVRLDVDDLFGGDNISIEDLWRIVNQMEDKTVKELEDAR